MSVPGNLNTAAPPSSFDDNADFYNESRWNKLKRKIFEEPLIPLGCALTCWALVEATRSIRSGDKHRTNQMFRRRIYAQGFTIMAMLAGSIYWEGDRQKRGQYTELLEDKKKKEKHELWLKELEAREEEEQMMRRTRDRMISARVAEKTKMSETEKRAVEKKTKEELGQSKGGLGEVRSVLEPSESRRGTIMEAVWTAWERRR